MCMWLCSHVHTPVWRVLYLIPVDWDVSLYPPVNSIISRCGFLRAKLLFWTRATLDTHFSHRARHWVPFGALHSCRGKTPNPRLKQIKPVEQSARKRKMWWILRGKSAWRHPFPFIHNFVLFFLRCFVLVRHLTGPCCVSRFAFLSCIVFLMPKSVLNIQYCPKWSEVGEKWIAMSIRHFLFFF